MSGKRVEDEIKISTPKGVKDFYILKIRYFEKQSSSIVLLKCLVLLKSEFGFKVL
ncbi:MULTISPECIES: hypothetical protein [Desulfobacula]